MDNKTRNAVEAHVKAISQWAFVATVPFASFVQGARRVKEARELSKKAGLDHIASLDDNDVAWPDHSTILDLIEAACRDAEALAAIDAHADAIKLLVKS